MKTNKSNIREFSNYYLLECYRWAIRDDHYNPTDKEYNESGYSLDQIEKEFYRRLKKFEEDDEL